jgi:hypothetical protein
MEGAILGVTPIFLLFRVVDWLVDDTEREMKQHNRTQGSFLLVALA